LYYETYCRTKLGMQNKTAIPAATFKALFNELVSWSFIYALMRRCGLRRRCPPVITAVELIQGLVFHVVAEAGTLAQHMKQVTGKSITDGALAQRRALLPPALFEGLMGAALKPKGDPVRHPEAFYHGLRLCGVDGTLFSISNTPPVKKQMNKARSRRGRSAFPKVGAVVMVELGLHNPLAASLGVKGESEMVLANRVLRTQPEKSLLINDRYYGVPGLLVGLPASGDRHLLVRVKKNLKRRLLEVYSDGSALVEIGSDQKTRLMREVLGRVQRGTGGTFTTVRLWTTLLDGRRYPAAELLRLYARRWEQELFYKELKVDMRSTPGLQSHTPLTAIQEITALILAYAVLVDYRMEAAAVGEVGVLRISFMKTLQVVQGLWQFLEVSADLLSPAQVRLVVRRSLQRIADMAIPKRRQRSCQRALRQPVSSWPRLRKNTCRKGSIQYAVGVIYA
jgi:hypothetical protein